MSGIIEVIETDVKTGRCLSRYRSKNRVTTLGETMMAERLRGNTEVSGISQYAIGGNSTPPVAGDVALLNELYRGPLTQSRVAGGQLIMTLHLGATQGNGLTFNEGGAFNDNGTLLCRGVFPDKSKDASKELTILHTIQITAT
jgi:hypothetical protein